MAVVPLLYEKGLDRHYDAVLLVDAPEETRIARVVQAGKMSEAEARAIAAAQKPAAEKRAHAHIVIDNDGDLAELERRARDAWERLRALAEGSG